MLLINSKEVHAQEFAWDGCHKIYLITSPKERELMESYGYGEDESEILHISHLPMVWEESCSLKFISMADLSVPNLINQFEDGTVEYRDEPEDEE